jgi:hypothetical protein
MLKILFPNNLDVLLKYLVFLHSNLRRKVFLFKPRAIDKAYVQVQYLDMDKNKIQQKGSKQIDQ